LGTNTNKIEADRPNKVIITSLMHHHYPILFNVMCSQVCQLVSVCLSLQFVAEWLMGDFLSVGVLGAGSVLTKIAGPLDQGLLSGY